MLQAARPCSRESSDIFARTPSTPSTQCGRGSAASKNGDGYEWRERFPDYANSCRTGREWATNRLFGRGWWVWIIPLQGGDVSAGIVYDSRIF